MDTGTTVIVMAMVIGLVLLILVLIGIQTVMQWQDQVPKNIKRTPCNPEELVLSVERGVPWLIHRPLNAPIVKVRVYDLRACRGTWVEERGEPGEDDHGKYLEVNWGKEKL